MVFLEVIVTIESTCFIFTDVTIILSLCKWALSCLALNKAARFFFCYRDAILIGLGNALTSLYSGFVIFSVLGYMSKIKGVSIDDVTVVGKCWCYGVVGCQLLSLVVVQTWWQNGNVLTCWEIIVYCPGKTEVWSLKALLGWPQGCLPVKSITAIFEGKLGGPEGDSKWVSPCPCRLLWLLYHNICLWCVWNECFSCQL